MSIIDRIHAKEPTHNTPHRVNFTEIWPLVLRLWNEERRDIYFVIVYGVIISLLGLVVPLSSQAVVNAVALGVHTEQLIVLCVLVLVAMLAIAVLLVLQRHVIDYIQRRQFLSTAVDIVHRLPRIREDSYDTVYVPELVNRFIDVVTVQKSISKFLLDGSAALLSLVTGFIVLIIYHPLFLLYDFVFLIFIPVLVFVLGRKAIATAVDESTIKYKTVEWIEEVARSHRGLKLNDTGSYAIDRVFGLSMAYADAKEAHFRIYARQILGSYIFKALAMVAMLALGGTLVINQQLSLGQLVAAEIIIVVMMGAMEKLLTLFDVYYDFAAALAKIQVINDLPLEADGRQNVPTPYPNDPIVRVVQYPPWSALPQGTPAISFDIPPQSITALSGPHSRHLTELAKSIAGLRNAAPARIELFGEDVSVLRSASLHRHVQYVDRDDVIHEGTVYDNIVVGRNVPHDKLHEILHMVQAHEELRELPKGLHTETVTLGRNLSHSLRQRIILARALAASPSLLVLNGITERLSPSIASSVVASLKSEFSGTLVFATHDIRVIKQSDYVVAFESDGSHEMYSSGQALSNSPFVCSLLQHSL